MPLGRMSLRIYQGNVCVGRTSIRIYLGKGLKPSRLEAFGEKWMIPFVRNLGICDFLKYAINFLRNQCIQGISSAAFAVDWPAALIR